MFYYDCRLELVAGRKSCCRRGTGDCGKERSLTMNSILLPYSSRRISLKASSLSLLLRPFLAALSAGLDPKTRTACWYLATLGPQ